LILCFPSGDESRTRKGRERKWKRESRIDEKRWGREGSRRRKQKRGWKNRNIEDVAWNTQEVASNGRSTLTTD
jgi:hypothetical protein